MTTMTSTPTLSTQQMGGKRKLSKWNKFTSKVYATEHRKNKNFKFKDALKMASAMKKKGQYGGDDGTVVSEEGDAGMGDADMGDAGMGDAGMGDAGMGDAGIVEGGRRRRRTMRRSRGRSQRRSRGRSRGRGRARASRRR
jgi:hypothetical protein